MISRVLHVDTRRPTACHGFPSADGPSSEPRSHRSCSVTTVMLCWTAARLPCVPVHALGQRGGLVSPAVAARIRAVARAPAERGHVGLVWSDASARFGAAARWAEFAAGRIAEPTRACVRGVPSGRIGAIDVPLARERAAGRLARMVDDPRRATSPSERRGGSIRDGSVTWLDLRRVPGARVRCVSAARCSAARCSATPSMEAVPAGCICWPRHRARSGASGRRRRTGAGTYARGPAALRLRGGVNLRRPPGSGTRRQWVSLSLYPSYGPPRSGTVPFVGWVERQRNPSCMFPASSGYNHVPARSSSRHRRRRDPVYARHRSDAAVVPT